MTRRIEKTIEKPVMASIGMPAIIGLCGVMGSGKDTVGALLSMVGYEMLGFGDALRNEVAQTLVRRVLPNDHMFPETFMASWHASNPDDVWAKPTTAAMRILLQYWGTEYRRVQDPNYWVNALAKTIQQGHRYAITDVRFENEVGFIRRYRDGKIWLIQREQARRDGIAGHVSEALYDTLVPDVRLGNNGTLRQLAHDVRQRLFRSEVIN